MRETDRKIAEWLGTDFHSCDNCEDWCRKTETPNYSESDAAAVTLLPELVKQGYDVFLDSTCSQKWNFEIYPRGKDNKLAYAHEQPTIAAAICAAITRMSEEGI